MGSFLAANLRRKWPDKSLASMERDWSHTETRGTRMRRNKHLLARYFLARPPNLQKLWPNFSVVLSQKPCISKEVLSVVSASGLPARWVLLSQEKFRPKAGPVNARSIDAGANSISVSRGLARSNSETSIYGNDPTGQSVAATHLYRRCAWDAMCHKTSCLTRHFSARRRLWQTTPRCSCRLCVASGSSGTPIRSLRQSLYLNTDSTAAGTPATRSTA